MKFLLFHKSCNSSLLYNAHSYIAVFAYRLEFCDFECVSVTISMIPTVHFIKKIVISLLADILKDNL